MEIIAVAFAALALTALALHAARRRARRAFALDATGLGAKEGAAAPRPPFRLPPPPRTLLTRLGKAVSPEPGDEVRVLLAESGTGWTAHYFQGVRAAAGLSLAALSLPLGLMALPLFPVLFTAGWRLPAFLLKRSVARRWERVAGDLPEVADLMAVLCYSGESLLAAFRHAVSACSNPYSRAEMERVLERIRTGESAAAALRAGRDHPCREMRRFSRTLARAEEFGAPVADTLEELAAELRNARREKDRVRAARVSVLILLPLVFLILPSFLLLTVGGMILGHTV